MKLILKDSTRTVEWSMVEVPLTEKTTDNVKQIKTLNNSLTTYIIGDRKRTWEHTWAYPTRVEYDEVKSFYDKQIQNQETLKLTIEGVDGVVDVPVWLEIGNREIMSFDGMVKEMKATFTEI